MRFHFLYGGRLEPLEAVDPSSRSRLGYPIQTDVGENTQVGIGLSGWWGQHVHAALERDGMPTFVRTLECGPGNTASRQLGL